MTSADLQRFDHVFATIKPKRLDTLKPEVKPYIGRRFVFSAAWIIDDGDYKGQWAMMVEVLDNERPPFAWVPFEDLSDIKDVPEGFDYTGNRNHAVP